MNRLWAVVLCFVAFAAAAQERPAAPSDYRQTAAVLAHYPAVADMQLDSPAFRTAQPTLTGQQALADFLAALARESARAKVASIGQSTQGRDIPIVYLTAEGLADPAAIRRLGRPVIWLIGQQHGNEPAGGEAMLALAAALARGELASLLAKVTVVIVPRANVDGAAADKRVLASGADPTATTCCSASPRCAPCTRRCARCRPTSCSTTTNSASPGAGSRSSRACRARTS